MSTQSKDMPMVDDLDQSDEVRSLLRAGIDDEVSGYDFEHGLATHLAAIAALPTAADTAPAAEAASAAAGISGKAWMAWIGVPVASASVIAALWFGSSETPTQTPGLSSVAKTVPIVAHGAPAKAPEQVVETAPTARTIGTTTTPVATSTPATQTTRARVSRAQRSASSTVASTKSSADVSVTAIDQAAALATAPAATDVSASAAANEVEAGPTAAEREAEARAAELRAEQERVAREEARRVAEERLKREMTQLMRAKQSLTSNPAQALALAQAGEQEFRNSLFSEERQHVLILALIKLGRVEEAERRATPYLSAHPDSPFARRVRNALDAAK